MACSKIGTRPLSESPICPCRKSANSSGSTITTSNDRALVAHGIGRGTSTREMMMKSRMMLLAASVMLFLGSGCATNAAASPDTEATKAARIHFAELTANVCRPDAADTDRADTGGSAGVAAVSREELQSLLDELRSVREELAAIK